MTFHQMQKTLGAALLGMAIAIVGLTAQAATDISTDPLNTYSAASSSDVKPNVLFVLDDSGSMDWDFMPDWACASYSTSNSACTSTGQNPSSARAEYLFRNASYNGVYYNPAVVYKPPVAVDSTGTLNTTTYPSMTGTAAATGADSSAKPNWKAVRDDAFGVQSTLTTVSDLQGNADKPPYFFTTVAGEYCTSPSLRICTTSNGPTTVNGVAYNYPAAVRWCNSSALTNCRAAFGDSYTYVRAPSPSISTFTISNASSGSASGLTVNGQQIMAGGSGTSSSTSTLAQSIVTQINKCTAAATGNCTTYGYHASSSGSTVTIIAPGATTAVPSFTKTGFTATPSAFSAGSIPGNNLVTVITPGVNSYPYPNTNAKAATRTDCAGTTCTYAEEMTNYANWWTYYRTRMQMMKSAASNAFAAIDSATDIASSVSRFRLGYMSINNNTSADYLNLNEFKGTQKYNWYRKLLAANPNNSTPLRAALSKAGQLYAGKFNGRSLNGSTVTDPLQYSCQQNYTILSTDGFWNESDSSVTQINQSTQVGNQDSGLARPYYDGGSVIQQASTSTLQSITANLQQSVYSGGKWGSWNNVSTCTPTNTVKCQYNWGSNAWVNASSCTVNYSSSGTWNISRGTNCQYTAWTTASTVQTCTPVEKSAGPIYTVATARQCSVSSTDGTTNTLADVAAYYYNTDLRNDAANTGVCVGPVIPPATTPNDLCDNNVPTYNRDTAVSQHMTTFTLGLGAQGQMVYAPEAGKSYWDDKSGDFYDVMKGTTADPANGICSWLGSGAVCNWPKPVSNANTTIDDLWHAAVNGHGTYFSAKDPDSLATSLAAMLKEAVADPPRPGTAAAAASSNPNVSAGDNFVFSTSFKSVEWFGELIRQQISMDGNLSTQNWSAMRLVDCAMTPWQASFNYDAGAVYRQGTSCYTVNTAYASGATFDGSAAGVDGRNISIINVDESASTKVAVTAPTTRTIYTKGVNSGVASLIPFTWASLQMAGLDSNFTAPHISYVSDTVGLSQFCPSGGNCLPSTAQTNTTIANGGAAGEALVNFLRGDRTYEGSYFRRRIHVLGDIVSSEARYVKVPLFNYADTGYSDFKAAMKTRSGTVYVGGNDGMLHAFDSDTGRELWAYIPSQMLPNLYALADKNYATKHQFFVDNSPETGDICPSAPGTACSATQWRTILVGGFNRGGKGYYALDITDPANPRLLWEFADANMGYSYGNPAITKLADGTWVVLLSSGYNNADGVGRVYVLKADTGALLRTISTGVGTAAAPSGLARISAHVPQPMINNTTRAAYGGDLLGNLWRFDINNTIGAAGYDAQVLAKFTDSTGKAQAITAKPLETTVNDHPVVYVGTGQYLGTTDITDASGESFYAVMDRYDTNTYYPRQTASKFVRQVLTSESCPDGSPASWCQPGQLVRTSTDNAIDWGTNNGWYLDFLTGGERSISDSTLGLGTLLFTTITPQQKGALACTSAPAADGSGSFLYALDYLNGGPVDGANGVSGVNMGNYYVTKPVMLQIGDSVVSLTRVSNGASSGYTDGGSTVTNRPPIAPSSASVLRRVSWRVLNGQ